MNILSDRVLTSFMVIPVLGIGATLFRDQVSSLYYAARGATGVCTLAESIQAPKITRTHIAGWQRAQKNLKLVRTDPEGLSLWDTPWGRFWMPSGSTNALAVDLAEQERRIYRKVRPGDVVIDAGANIGLYTKRALADGASLVIAVEPSPENLECLRRNLAEEIRRNKVVVYPKGVWDRDDFLEMNIDPNNTAANSFVRRTGAAGKTLRLPLTTVDNLVRELQLSRVDFIKMDIEGAERNALEGARETLKKFKPRMAICVYHLLDDPVVVSQIVATLQPGYTRECDCQRYTGGIQAEIMHFY